jgi:hypothetical protein
LAIIGDADGGEGKKGQPEGKYGERRGKEESGGNAGDGESDHETQSSPSRSGDRVGTAIVGNI